MIKRLWTAFAALSWAVSMTPVTAFAEDGFSAGEGALGAIGCGIVTPVIVMTILCMKSLRKWKATEANDYIKEERGGRAVITNRQDTFERSYTETRKSDGNALQDTVTNNISSTIASKAVDAATDKFKQSISKK